MKIGILQTGTSPDGMVAQFGSYGDLFKRLLAGRGFDFSVHDIEHMDFPPGPEAADGWLITGSRHGAYEDHPFIAPLEALIRDIRQAGRPLVGICFGHQIVAQALGGKVEKFDGGWSVGPVEYDFEGEPIRLNAWHRDQVTEVPPDAEVIAGTPFCRYAGLRYGDDILTVQPHPEMTPEFLGRLAEERGRGLVPDDQLAVALAAAPVTDGPARLADRIARFLRARVPA